MIIGSGLLGVNLKRIDNKQYLFFASGVSNSKSNDEQHFQREKQLLANCLENYPEQLFIYFSTYSIFDSSLSDYKYIKHKLEMEDYIKEHASKYLIIRTSNLIGHIGNPNTILRFICNSIQDNKQLEIWKNAFRNILDIDHFIMMLDVAIKQNYKNEILTLVNPIEYPIQSIVSQCEYVLNKTANVSSIDKGIRFEYDKVLSKDLFQLLSISTDNYLRYVLEKYFK